MDSASGSTHLERPDAILGKLPFLRLLLLLFAISFIIHTGIVILFINQPIALDDMYQYDMLARSLEAGNGYRWYSKADVEVLRPYYAQFLDVDHLPFPERGLETTFRAPGYPFFLAFFYLLVPSSSRFVLARLVQAALAASLTPIAAVLGRQVGLPHKVCLFAGLGLSFYPILLFYPVGLVSEDLYIPLGLLAVILVLCAAKRKTWGWLLLAGLICGLLMLTRSIFAGFTLLAAVWISRAHPHKKLAALIFLLAAFGLCLPWSIRNSLLMHRPAFVENSLGYNLFIGYNPQGDGGFVSKVAIQPMNILDDGERERICLQQALEFIRQAPLESARRVLVRLVKFLGPEDREFFYFYSNDLVGAFPPIGLVFIYLLLIVPWGATLMLGAIGLWRLPDRSSRLLILFFLLGYGLPHLFIIAEPRFHLAWVPILLPVAAFGWTTFRRSSTLKRNKQELILFWGLLALLSSIFLIGFFTDLPTFLTLIRPGGNQLGFSY